MLPFESFTLGKFRGLTGLALEGLGRVNVLVGSNNSGKTSVLEALELACGPLTALNWLVVADQRDSRSNAIDRIDNLLWMFPQAADRADTAPSAIELSMTGSHPLTKVLAEVLIEQATSGQPPAKDHKLIVSESERHFSLPMTVRDVKFTPTRLSLNDVKQFFDTVYQQLQGTEGTPSEFGEALSTLRRVLDIQVTATHRSAEAEQLQFKVIEGMQFLSRDSDAGTPRVACASIAPLSHRVRSIHADRLSRAKEAGIDQDAVALLQQFDPAIKDLDILARQGTFADVRIRHASLGLAPLNAFGDGMRRALLYALTIPQVRGGVLLIDEIESAIHVRALAGVFAWLTRACEQFDVQIFASTHSLEALEGLLGDDERGSSRTVGFHLPGRPGERAVTRYDGDMLTRLVRDRGLDVR